MRKMKKPASLLLALVMVLAMGVTAMASSGIAPATHTITITSEKSGHTYEAYQIFTGVLDSTGEILSDIDWGSGVMGAGLLTALQADTTVVGTDSVSGDDITVAGLFADCISAADVAQVLSDYHTNTDLAKQFAQLASENLAASATGTSTEAASPYTISGLSAGYYLVKDQDGSATAEGDAYTDIILEVVSDVSVVSKTVYPTVEKTVSDEDANISDTVTYTLTGTVPDTSAYSAYTYIFHDTMSAGLDYVENSLTVTVKKTGESNKTLTEGTKVTESGVTTTTNDYVVNVETDAVSGITTITVEIFDAKQYSESSIVVAYQATLNSNAVIGGTGNDNVVYVEYSNNPNWDGTGTEPTGNTPEDEVVTWTFELDVTKVDGKTGANLKDAAFVLYKTVKETVGGTEEDVDYYLQTDSTGKVTGWTVDDTAASTLKSAADGTFSVIGLDVGTYYLKETAAPDGYNLMAGPVTVVISATYKDNDGDGNDDAIDTLTATADSTSLSTNISDGTITATVKNNAGSILPSTGGIGTTIFCITGTIMMLGAAVVLITRRRMRSAE
ncbi:MAG: SpaH/EbpB family LPXTG-anchored major pilin [Lachnospiraceae bacterium]|nr:SpaH/EbpB family LPXTG-anchored major pilin [Lachnospiraceae bacterium]